MIFKSHLQNLIRTKNLVYGGLMTRFIPRLTTSEEMTLLDPVEGD